MVYMRLMLARLLKILNNVKSYTSLDVSTLNFNYKINMNYFVWNEKDQILSAAPNSTAGLVWSDLIAKVHNYTMQEI